MGGEKCSICREYDEMAAIYNAAVGLLMVFFFQEEDGIRDAQESRGLGYFFMREADGMRDLVRSRGFGCVYKSQSCGCKNRDPDLRCAPR